MREWATPRVIGVTVILIGGPLAALAQLAFSWYPQTRRVARLDHEVRVRSGALEAECAAVNALRAQVEQLERSAGERARANAHRWLAARDREGVFDRLAAHLPATDVAIEELASGEPVLFGGGSRAHLLAAEAITVRCTGDYAALTAALDRVAALGVPLQFTEIVWDRTPTGLALRFVVQTPFVPDDALRQRLADGAGLKRDEP